MNVIETKQLDFRYSRNDLIRHLDIQVPQGSVYGYIGKNGAGKTTTIKLLLGLLPCKTGSVFYNGLEFHEHRVDLLGRIGSLVENPCLYNHLTCAEQLKYLDLIYNKGDNRIDETLEMVGLIKEKNKRIKQLSTGMKQRFGIGMAIFHNPEIIILDEPINGLDPYGVHDVRELILRLHGEGKTVFISSHILSEMERICTHIGIIDKGRLLFQGETSELCKKAKGSNLETVYMNIIDESYEDK